MGAPDTRPLRILPTLRAVDRALLAALIVAAAGFLLLLLVGAARWYSPVPLADMWNSYILSYTRIPDSGALEYIWSPHNEHRIPISRLLFWMDLRFFNGRSLLLIPLNILFMIGIWAVLAAAARELLAADKTMWLITAAAAALPIWSWVQWFNVASGFQGMFFLAYLIPLIAFTALAKASITKSKGWFAAALICGGAAVGTMANGIATLPLMCIALLLTKDATKSWMAGLALTTVVVLGVWFYGYAPISSQAPAASIRELIVFVTSFFGSPAAAALGVLQPSLQAGYIAGAIFLLATAFVAANALRRRDPMFIGLLTFLAYLGMSAAAAAWGRAAVTGVSDMVRYTTPAVIGWSVVLVLCAAIFQQKARTAVAGVGLLLGAILYSYQMDVFHDEAFAWDHRLMVPALALELKVPDAAALSAIYPISTPQILNAMQIITDRAEAAGITMFGDANFARQVRRIGQSAADGYRSCNGSVDGLETIAGTSTYRRVAGWAFDPRTGKPPAFVYIADETHIVGVAVTGALRPDVANLVGVAGKLSGFTGYITGNAANLSILCANARN